jgi:hypothetical protein
MLSKIIFSSILFLGIINFEFVNSLKSHLEEYVYLCNGGSSKVYHKRPDCRGLSNCSTQIEKVTVSLAIGKGRRACRIEY